MGRSEQLQITRWCWWVLPNKAGCWHDAWCWSLGRNSLICRGAVTRPKVGLLHAAAGTDERKEVYEVLWSGQDEEMKSSDTSKMWAAVSSSIQGRHDSACDPAVSMIPPRCRHYKPRKWTQIHVPPLVTCTGANFYLLCSPGKMINKLSASGC